MTKPVFVPAGTTSQVQPVDVAFNAPFKTAIDAMANSHLQENLDDYVKGRISATQRRILFMKWVGKVWEDISGKKDNIICSLILRNVASPWPSTAQKTIG